MPSEVFQQLIDNVYEVIANQPGVTTNALAALTGHKLRDVQRATKHLREADEITGTKNPARTEWRSTTIPEGAR